MPGPPLALDTYQKLFSKCILTRTPPEHFERYLNQLHSRSPIPPSAVASVILSPSVAGNAPDPLHLEYIGLLIERDIVSLAQILDALLKTSNITTALDGSTGRDALEQDIFLVLGNALRTQKPRTPESVWAGLQATSEWMEAVVSSAQGMLGDGTSGADTAMMAGLSSRGRLEALGEMVIALGANEDVVRLLGETGKKEKMAFQTSLAMFIQYVQVQNPPLASRLDMIRQQQQSPRQSRILGKGGASEIDGLMMGLGGDGAGGPEQGILSRAHLFVWLNALLAGRPHVDDDYIVGYLYSRYKDAANEIVTDFVTAVIDTLSSAINRNEPSSTLFLFRSFLVNKVPLLLVRLSQSPAMATFAISQAFLRADSASLINISPNNRDPYSSGANGTSPDMFGGFSVDLRPEFLFACALHGIINETDITGILGELPICAMPASGRYNAQELLAEYSMDNARLDRLLEEIESLEGNSGAVCKALFEIMKGMCEQRETMPLKNVCHFLARKPSSIDVMLLFIKPSEILEPLSDLLDTWRYEEDQGEYQPVYEEFGYILLFVLIVCHRYSLTSVDISLSHPATNESFIPQLLLQYSNAQRIENLDSSDRHAQLGGWIKDLFEGEGISDGLMMACRPQDFYRLVPTLFSQSILACQRGVLDLETVKEAFSFFLCPFLLPSIISGLTWLCHHLWANLDSPHNTLHLISTLVTAPSLSPETAEVHRTAVAITSRTLDTVLRELIRRSETSREIADSILTYIRPLLSFKRSGSPSREDLDNLCHHTGGIASTLANAFSQLCSWPENGSPPATYTPRILVAARSLLGPARTAEIIVKEARKVSGIGEDVAVAICGSFGASALLDALRGMLDDEIARTVLQRVEALQVAGLEHQIQGAAGGGADAGNVVDVVDVVDVEVHLPDGLEGFGDGKLEFGDDTGMDIMMGDDMGSGFMEGLEGMDLP